MALQPGHHLGPYEIPAAIAAGGMGEVYCPQDAKLRRDGALKVLPEAFARDAERMARFERKTQATAAATHLRLSVRYRFGDISR